MFVGASSNCGSSFPELSFESVATGCCVGSSSVSNKSSSSSSSEAALFTAVGSEVDSSVAASAIFSLERRKGCRRSVQ